MVGKADEDIHVLEILLNDSRTSDAIWGFHAQQAVEKLLKAILTNRDLSFPFVHRLLDLADLLNDAGCPIPDDYEPLLDLTPYAVEFRYSPLGATNAPSLVRQPILALIRSFRDYASDMIGASDSK